MSTLQPQQVAYGLSQALLPLQQQTIIAKRNPTSSDRAQIGTTWINEVANTYFVLTSVTSNTSNWESTSVGNGTNGQVLIGGGTQPIWNNITAGTGVTITNGVNSITIATAGSVATTLNADSGSATFSGGAATIAGGANVSTSATLHTLTVSLVSSPSVTGSLTAGTGITATTGNISASSGNIIASGTVTAGTGLIASADGVVTTGTNQFKSLTAGVMQTSSNGTISSTGGTDGQILISSSAGAPAWATITAGSNVSITNGHNSITIAASGGSGGTVSQLSGNSGVAGPDSGGNINVVGSGNVTITGDNSHTLTATLTGTTQYAVQVGGSTGALSSLSVGTNGQVLLGHTTNNPSFVTPTAGDGLSLTTNATTLEYAIDAPLAVEYGGTSGDSFTENGVLCGNGTSVFQATAVGTNGQLLIGSTGNLPAFATLTSSGGTITYTTGSNSLNIDGTAATTSQAGVVELASSAQAIAGVSTTTATPPGALAAKLGTQTTNGVAYGAGTSSALSWTSAGTNGQLLIGATSAAPAFGSVTSTGGTITITTGANSLNLDVTSGSATKLNADTGFATFTGGAITIAGGTGISTSASAATLTVNIATPVSVANGGTGATTLTGVLIGNGTSAVTASTITQYDVLVGGSSNAISSISPSTAGYVLTSNGVSANPSFQAVGSSSVSITGDTGGALTGNSFTFTGGATGLSFGGSGSTETLSGTVVVAHGGTGQTTLASHGVVYGNGASGVGVTAAGTNGQLLIGGTSAAPAFATVTSTNSTLAFTAGSNTLNIDVNAPLSVSYGGTGNTSVSAYAVVCGGTTNTGALQVVSGLGTSGYVLTSNGGGALPSWKQNAVSNALTTANTDSGSATTSSNTITWAGGSNINTSGSGSAVTINLNNSPSVSGTLTASGNIRGGGLTFDGTNVMSTYIDASSWTPVLNFGGASVGITYSVQSGNYIMIGNLIYFNFAMTLTSKGSSTGDVAITGLPYSSASSNQDQVVIREDHVTYPNTVLQILGSVAGTQIGIIGLVSGGSVAIITDANFANNSIVRGSGCYIV